MLTGDVRPSTLDGIKRLAAQIRRERGIKHSVALDLAASAANFSNFRNAQRLLRRQSVASSDHYVLLTMYWYDKQKRRSGRETLHIGLPKALNDICNKALLRNARGFGGMRVVAEDHLVCDMLAASQDSARGQLSTAARSLCFINHTGLQPAGGSKRIYTSAISNLKFPGRDHATLWDNPATGSLVLIDEPYRGADQEAQRTIWAEKSDWRLVRTSWPGMYRPYECDLYIVMEGRFSAELAELRSKIEAMPPPLLEENWPGESVPSWETFLSPKATTPQDARRARCRGTIYPAASKTTEPYSYSLGVTRRRPAGKMKIEQHIHAGGIIKAVLGSGVANSGAYFRLNSLRSTLEDWMSMEIGRNDLQGPEFFEVYYSEAPADAAFWDLARTRDGVLSMLEDLKKLLADTYPDCAPLRRQINKISISISQIARIKDAT